MNRFRNLDPQRMFEQLALEHQPLYAFTDKWSDDFEAWKKEAYPRVLATLGDRPPRVQANAELIVEWEHDGLRKQRWMLDVGPHIAAVLRVNIPGDLANGEKRPAILCCHGHSVQGKDVVMGDQPPEDAAAPVAKRNSNYGHMMAKAGFVTYAIDWIGFGQRNPSRKPNHRSQAGTRDWCNILYLHATMFGMTSLSINVTHGQAATDFVSTLDFVDADRLGVMGLSGGGTMTTWMAFCDERFKAIEIICYSDLWAAFGMRDTNYCGMQVAPGLYKLVDVPDLQGLLAPRPLLIDLGANDTCFVIDTAMASFEQTQRIYTAAGAVDRLELDLHPGEHGWGGNKSEAFFNKWLAAD